MKTKRKRNYESRSPYKDVGLTDSRNLFYDKTRKKKTYAVSGFSQVFRSKNKGND